MRGFTHLLTPSKVGDGLAIDTDPSGHLQFRQAFGDEARIGLGVLEPVGVAGFLSERTGNTCQPRLRPRFWAVMTTSSSTGGVMPGAEVAHGRVGGTPGIRRALFPNPMCSVSAGARDPGGGGRHLVQGLGTEPPLALRTSPRSSGSGSRHFAHVLRTSCVRLGADLGGCRPFPQPPSRRVAATHPLFVLIGVSLSSTPDYFFCPRSGLPQPPHPPRTIRFSGG